MKAIIFSSLFVIFAGPVHADLQTSIAPVKVACLVQEFSGDQSQDHTYGLESSEDKHGAMIFPKLNLIPEVDLMIAFYKGLIVVNAYHNPSGISSASHSDVMGSQNAHFQMNLGTGKSLAVNCILDLDTDPVKEK